MGTCTWHSNTPLTVLTFPKYHAGTSQFRTRKDELSMTPDGILDLNTSIMIEPTSLEVLLSDLLSGHVGTEKAQVSERWWWFVPVAPMAWVHITENELSFQLAYSQGTRCWLSRSWKWTLDTPVGNLIWVLNYVGLQASRKLSTQILQ